MPELPEVETMVNRLQKYVGYKVNSLLPSEGEDTERYHEIYFHPPQELRGVFRRGKFMVFMLEDCALLAHNAMSGYWDEPDEPWTFDYVEGKRQSSETDVRSLIDLTDGKGSTRFLQFHDARKFGYLKYVTPEKLAEKLSQLGPDALETDNLYEPTHVMTEDEFIKEMKKSKQPIKSTLLEQKRIAGVGNIYAAEACWAASIDPKRAAKDISDHDLLKLFLAIQFVLEKAIDSKLDYSALLVYGQKWCPNCKTPIVIEEIKGRSTYWCPACQK